MKILLVVGALVVFVVLVVVFLVAARRLGAAFDRYVP